MKDLTTSESNPDNAPTIGGFLQNLHVVVEGEAAVVLAWGEHRGAQDCKLGRVVDVCGVQQQIGSYSTMIILRIYCLVSRYWGWELQFWHSAGHSQVSDVLKDLFITAVLAASDPNIHDRFSSTRLFFCSRAFRWAQAVVHLWNQVKSIGGFWTDQISKISNFQTDQRPSPFQQCQHQMWVLPNTQPYLKRNWSKNKIYVWERAFNLLVFFHPFISPEYLPAAPSAVARLNARQFVTLLFPSKFTCRSKWINCYGD